MTTEKRIKIENQLGLHARPAALFVQTASKYKSKIFVRKGNLEVNGKSIMGVMMLAAESGSELIVRAEGHDALEAISALVKLVKEKFYEE